LAQRINWTDLALDDLSEIQQFITRDNPFAARTLAARIVEAAESLAEFPNRGRPGDEPGGMVRKVGSDETRSRRLQKVLGARNSWRSIWIL
jgi:plasmid stabilization system protein ParE